MLAEISAGFGSLKAAKDIIQGLNAANTQASVNDVKIALGQHVLDAHIALAAANDAQSAAARRIADLEQEIVRLKDWSAEKQNYELQAIGAGATAYVEKRSVQSGQAPHWLCANCYDSGQKAILQPRQSIDHDAYRCPKCSADIKVTRHATPESHVATQRNRQLGPGATCPRCNKPEFRIERSEPDRLMGPAGANRRWHRCYACDFEEQSVT